MINYFKTLSKHSPIHFKKEKTETIIAPMCCYDLDFIKSVLNMHLKEYTQDEICFFFRMCQDELNHILDMYLELYMDMGTLQYKQKEK